MKGKIKRVSERGEEGGGETSGMALWRDEGEGSGP